MVLRQEEDQEILNLACLFLGKVWIQHKRDQAIKPQSS